MERDNSWGGGGAAVHGPAFIKGARRKNTIILVICPQFLLPLSQAAQDVNTWRCFVSKDNGFTARLGKMSETATFTDVSKSPN